MFSFGIYSSDDYNMSTVAMQASTAPVLQQQLLLKHRFLLPLCLYLCEGFGVIPIVSGLVSIANKDQ